MALTVQVATLSRQIVQINVNAIHISLVVCEFYGGAHSRMECTTGNPSRLEQVPYVAQPRPPF